MQRFARENRTDSGGGNAVSAPRLQRRFGQPLVLSQLISTYLPDLLAVVVFFLLTVQWDGIGKFLTLGWIGLVAMLVLSRHQDAFKMLTKWWPLLLTPLILVLSFAWSDYPGISAKYGLQIVYTAFVGLFFAYVLGPKRLTLALFIAMFAFCFLSILIGRQGPSAEGPVLIGLTGSKNQMGYAGHMLFASALAVMFQNRWPPGLRMTAVLGALIGLFIVLQVRATSALLNTAITGALFIGLAPSQRLTPGGRAAGFGILAAICAPLLLIIPELNQALDDFMVNVLHKDRTLTGRTYLWDRAMEMIHQRPLLGWGYQTAWLGDSAMTTGLLRWAGITDGRSFSFHNTYLQLAVDCGIIGATVFTITVISVFIAGLRQYIFRPTNETTFFFVFFIVMLSRSFVEPIISTFSIAPVMLFSIMLFAFWKPATSTAAAASTRPNRATVRL